MFTGLISGIGSLLSIKKHQFTFQCPDGWLGNSNIGDSIAVNGICLTIVTLDSLTFTVDISTETLQRISPLQLNNRVNLEQALKLGNKLGGHFVTGHVDGQSIVQSITPTADGGCDLSLLANISLLPTIAPKGSVTLAGVSLTVNYVSNTGFDVHLIPQTLTHTTLQNYQIGDTINLEIDILARHVQRLMQFKPC